jgi:hypothetical protein
MSNPLVALAAVQVSGQSATLMNPSKFLLSVPDPNQFNDVPEIYTENDREWRPVAECAGYKDSGRGHGLSEMTQAMSEGRAHRASGDLGFHVLEVMESILKSAEGNSRIEIKSKVGDIPLLPLI